MIGSVNYIYPRSSAGNLAKQTAPSPPTAPTTPPDASQPDVEAVDQLTLTLTQIEEKLVPFLVSRGENYPYDQADIDALESVLADWPDDIPIFDHLTPSEAKIAFINYVISVKDNTNEREYIPIDDGESSNPFVCHHFSLQTYINLTNGEVNLSRLNNIFTEPILPAKYRLPIYIFSEGRIAHSTNAVLIGNNESNLNDWYFFEPQFDLGHQGLNLAELSNTPISFLRPDTINDIHYDRDDNANHFFIKSNSEIVHLINMAQGAILHFAVILNYSDFAAIILNLSDSGTYNTANIKSAFDLGIREGILDMDYLQNAVRAMQGGRRKRELTRFLRELASEIDSNPRTNEKNISISSNKQTAPSDDHNGFIFTREPSTIDSYNPGISILIGEYLGELDDDNVIVRTNAARDLMVLAGSDIPDDQKIRMISPLTMALDTILRNYLIEDLDFIRYATRALLSLSSISASLQPRISLVRTLGRSKDALIEMLEDPDTYVQETAARTLIMLANSDLDLDFRFRLLSPLIKIFGMNGLALQMAAATTITQILGQGQSSVEDRYSILDPDRIPQIAEALLMAFENGPADLRETAAIALAGYDILANTTGLEARMVDPLLLALANEDEEVRCSAAYKLELLARSDLSPDLKARLIDPLISSFGRVHTLIFILAPVAEALIALVQSNLTEGDKARILDLCRESLMGPDSEARHEAARVFIALAQADLSPELKLKLIEPLVNIAGDEEIYLRDDAADALAALAISDLPANQRLSLTEPLLTAYENYHYIEKEKVEIALAALAALGIPQELRARMIEPLIAAYEHYSYCGSEIPIIFQDPQEDRSCEFENLSTQALIISAGWDLPEEQKLLLLNPLLDIYEESDTDLKMEAARALTRFAGLNLSSYLASRLMEAMLFVLADEDPVWRRAAAETLIWLAPNQGDETLILPLLNIFEDPSLNLQIEAAYALAAVAVAYLPAEVDSRARMIAPLTRAFRQGNLETRKNAAVGLANLARTNLPSGIKVTLAPMLLEAFEDPNLNDLQREIADVLVEFMYLPLPSEQRRRMVEPLVMAFNNNEELEIKIRAVWALLSLAPLNILSEIKIKMLEPILTAATDPAFNMQREALLALAELAGLNLTEENKTRLADLFISALPGASEELRNQLAWALVTIATSNPPAGLKDRIIDALTGTPEQEAAVNWAFSRVSRISQLGDRFFREGDYENAALIFSLLEHDPVFSPLAQTFRALSESPELFQISEVTLAGGLKIRSFRRADESGVDFHVFYTEESISTIVTGEAQLTWQEGGQEQTFTLGARSRDLSSRSNIDLGIYYSGTFGRVTFQNIDSSTTLDVNNILLDLSHRTGVEALPQQLFNGLNSTIVSTRTATELDFMGVYSSDTDSITLSFQSQVDTVVHELAHHWDLMVTQEGYQADVSRIFRSISWEGDRRHDDDLNDFRGATYSSCESHSCSPGPVNSQLNLNQNPHPYGMENNIEDLATYAEDYFADGRNLRVHVRTQMALGNFEPAVKYLFMRYYLYQGVEYGASETSLSLGYREIIQALNSLDAESAADVRATTRRVLDEIRTAFALE